MPAFDITCGCAGSSHAAMCLRSLSSLRTHLRRGQPLTASPPARGLLVTCEDKRSPKKKPAKTLSKPAPMSAAPERPGQPPAAASQPEPPLPPPRVSSTLNVPVRLQIQLAQAQKQAAQPMSLLAKRQAVAYRRPAMSEDAYSAWRAEKEAESQRLSKRESKNFALSSLYMSDRGLTRTPKVLLVDGYNVLFKWMKDRRQKERGNLAEGDLEDAREALVEALTVYSHFRGVRVVVAFDAMGGGSCSTEEELRSTGLTVAFCGDQEADTFIEAQVEHFLARGYHQVVVATSDNLHADIVRDKRAAPHQTCYVVPASGLINDMERAARDSAATVAGTRAAPALARLGSAVRDKDAATFAKLQQWRVADRRRGGGGGGGGSGSGGSSSSG